MAPGGLPCHWGPHPQAPSLWGPGCGAVGLLALYALNPGYTYTRVTSSADLYLISAWFSNAPWLIDFAAEGEN